MLSGPCWSRLRRLTAHQAKKQCPPAASCPHVSLRLGCCLRPVPRRTEAVELDLACPWWAGVLLCGSVMLCLGKCCQNALCEYRRDPAPSSCHSGGSAFHLLVPGRRCPSALPWKRHLQAWWLVVPHAVGQRMDCPCAPPRAVRGPSSTHPAWSGTCDRPPFTQRLCSCA